MLTRSFSLRRTLVAALFVLLALAPFAGVSSARAATFDQINSDEVWLEEAESGTCTLTAATMMVRRAALLNGDLNWRSITLDAMRPYAWLPGLPYSFAYDDIEVSVGWLESGNHAGQLIALLAEHPEGIVLYHSGYNPHAVLLCDYTDGIFWAVDPVFARKVPIDECYHVTIENASQYWYVTSPVAPIDDHELKIEPGWHLFNNAWYVFDEDGMPVTGFWTDPDTKLTYYLDDTGKMMRGWCNVEGTWYLMAESGIMQTGWVAMGSHWYYFNEDGSMVTGWFLDEGTGHSYFFDASGSMRRGWLCDEGVWFYLQPSGIMLTGWQVIGKHWYHFDPTYGAMTVGLFTDADGNGYYFDADGHMAYGWRCVNGTWYFFQPSGIMARSMWVDGYYVQADGSMATNTYLDGGMHVGSDGRIDGSVRAN